MHLIPRFLQEEDTTGGFRYLAVQPSSPPSPRSEGGLSPASTPSTPLARRRSSGSALGAEADAASTASGSSGSWPGLRGRSGREQRREEKERLGRSGRRQQSGEGERLDLAPEAAYSRRQRWMRDPPVSASPITPPESASDGGSGDEASGSGTPRSRGRGGGRSKHGGSDHHMAYLLRRQLKVRAGAILPHASARACLSVLGLWPLEQFCSGAAASPATVPSALVARRRSAATRASASWCSLLSFPPGTAGRWALGESRLGSAAGRWMGLRMACNTWHVAWPYMCTVPHLPLSFLAPITVGALDGRGAGADARERGGGRRAAAGGVEA